LSRSPSYDLKVEVARVAAKGAEQLADVAERVVPNMHDRTSEAHEGALEGTVKNDCIGAVHDCWVLFAPLDSRANARSHRDHAHLERSSGSADLSLAALTSLNETKEILAADTMRSVLFASKGVVGCNLVLFALLISNERSEPLLGLSDVYASNCAKGSEEIWS
jgi:hypothetical protein